MKASGRVFKYGDNVDTDVIIPARYLNSSDPAELATHCMEDIDKDFIHKVKKGDSIVAEKKFGCGSSREHAALAPLYLGVKAIICKSFARIHRQNLINNGILPLEFVNEADYDRIEQGDDLVIANIRNIVENGGKIIVEDKTKGFSFEVKCELSERGKGMMLAGGLLNYTKANG